MGQSAVFGAGDFLTIAADGSQESRSPKMDVIVVGGKPIREPLAWAGPFVMNTKSEVMQAYEDFQRGHFGHIPLAATRLRTGRARRRNPVSARAVTRTGRIRVT